MYQAAKEQPTSLHYLNIYISALNFPARRTRHVQSELKIVGRGAFLVTYVILSHAEPSTRFQLHVSYFCIYSQYDCVDVIVRHIHRGKVQKVD